MTQRPQQPGRSEDVAASAVSARSGRRAAWGLSLVIGWLAAPFILRAQVIRIEPLNAGDIASTARLQPANDRDAESWLRRAEEAAARGDWKLAADTLERVIDQHGDRTVTIDESQYYSATHLVEQQLRAWPEEGLTAYRLLYDAEVKRLLERGRDAFDWEALRLIARKYPMSTYGPEAIDLLAGRLLDRGSASEAISHLGHLQTLPHSHVPRWSIVQRRFIAFVLTDQRPLASAALDELRTLGAGGGADLPDDWPHRLERLTRFFEQRKQAAPAAAVVPTSWPYRNGPRGQMGRMSAIEHLADRESAVRLDGADAKLRRQMFDLSRSRSRPPVWQAVSDGERLFVASPEGIVARDLLSFDLEWKAVLKRRIQPRISDNSQRMQLLGMIRGNQFELREEDPSRRLDTRIVQTLFHEYRGEISTAHGLVFALEQDTTPDEHPPTTEGIVPTNDHVADEDLGAANTLRAYEASTGRALWARGLAGPPDDELQQAHFRAAPVAAGEHLIAPCSIGGDLYLAVLRPDGSLVRKVLLGSGRASLFPLNGVLPLLLHDGTIYVQTGAGMFLALHEHDFSLKWLTAYERTGIGGGSRNDRMWGGPSSLPQPDEWLSSPPVVAGGHVIATPHDSARLHAFDLSDGREAWTLPRNSFRYLIGATPTEVVLAGDRVGVVEARTGSTVWVSDALFPTGRGAISGEQVLMPAGKRLLRLSLATGELIAETDFEQPLGNLLVFEGSLYSVGPDRICKILDPTQSAQLAQARLERNPDDVEAILLLALLAEIRKEHADAVALLDRADDCIGRLRAEAGAVGDAARAGMIDGLEAAVVQRRVSTLLGRAAAAADDERLALLQQAVQIARRPTDVSRAAIELCDQLIAMGRATDAFRAGLELFSRTGTRLVDVPDDRNLSVRSDALIGESLSTIWAELDEAGRRQAVDLINAMLAAQPASERGQLGESIADVLGFLPDAARRDLALGMQAWQSGRLEAAVFYFERASHRAADDRTRAEALVAVAVVCRYPGAGLPPLPDRAAAAVRRLLDEFAGVRLGEGAAADLLRAAGLPAAGDASEAAGLLAQTLPAALRSGAPPFPSILESATRLALRHEVAIPADAPGGTAAFWQPWAGPDIFAPAVPLQLSRQWVALRRDAARGREFDWAADIARDDLRDEPADPLPESQLSACAVSGAVMAAHADTGLFAVGLCTGRLMWAEFDRDDGLDLLPSPGVVAVNGLMVAATGGGTLSAWFARDSEKRIWRRDWPTIQIRTLRVIGDSVLAIDRNATRAILINPENGRIQREYSILTGEAAQDAALDELQSTDTDAHVAVVGGVLCRSGHRTLVGRDVTTGRVLWSVELSGGVNAMFELDDQHIGVCYKPNLFRVILARGGHTVIEPDMDGLVAPPLDAVVSTPTRGDAAGAPRLVIFARSDDLPPEHALVSFPLSGAGQPARRMLGPSAQISTAMMRASPDFVAVVRNEIRETDVARAFDNQRVSIDPQVAPRLEFVSKSTCARLRPRWYEFDEGKLGTSYHKSRLITDVMVFDDCVVALAPEGAFILADHQSVAVESR